MAGEEFSEVAAEEGPAAAVSITEQSTADPGEPCSPHERSGDLSESHPRLSRTERTLQEWASTRTLLHLRPEPEQPFWKAFVLDWTATLVVGFLVVSYWRVSYNVLVYVSNCAASHTKPSGHLDFAGHLDLRSTGNGWHDEWRILLLCRQYWHR